LRWYFFFRGNTREVRKQWGLNVRKIRGLK
jgi:hypothetical protein